MLAKLYESCVGLNVMEQMQFCRMAQSLAVARIASAHLCFCKSRFCKIPGMDCTTRCLNPGSLTEGREAICFTNAKVKRTDLMILCRCPQKGNVSLGRAVWSNRWGWMGTRNKSCFEKGVMNGWHKLSWEGRKVGFHKNWKTEWIYFFQNNSIYN